MKRKLITLFMILLVSSVVGTYFILNFSYSNGVRTGKLVKISKKGLLLKTYEGTLDLGSGDQLTWQFSVHDDQIGDELIVQAGQTVRLNYQEHLYKLYFATKYNVVSWETVKTPLTQADYLNSVLCRFINIIREDKKIVEKIRSMIMQQAPEILPDIRACQI